MGYYVGFDTWELRGNKEEKILWALKAVHCHFDTSPVYEIEIELDSDEMEELNNLNMDKSVLYVREKLI